MTGRHLLSSRKSSDKSSEKRKRLLRAEQLEAREMMSGTSLLAGSALSIGTRAAAAVVRNAAPTVAQAVSVGGGSTITGTSASISVMGNDDGGEANLIYQWSASGGATFSANGTNEAKNTTISFVKAGTYTLSVRMIDQAGRYTTNSLRVVVAQVPSGFAAFTSSYSTSTTSVKVTVPRFIDQFGNTISAAPVLSWSATSMPDGAPTPTFSGAGLAMTAAFGKAGSYTLKATSVYYPNLSFSVTVSVNQTLKSVALTPNTATVLQGVEQQFAFQTFDQFKNAMENPPATVWTTTTGTISSSGLFVGSAIGKATVMAKCGSLSAKATVTIQANPTAVINSTLSTLTKSLFADGSISRADMIQILRCTEADGVVDATEFSDLKKIVSQASAWNIPEYVRVLASDVVNGNTANAKYQGTTLGNLAAGSTAAQMEKLIGKWFLGADVPALTSSSITYKQASGSLFAQSPSYLDEHQGALGDCYFITALGMLADSNPNAVKNMFIDNGDGTYTVRFYSGSYSNFYNSDGSISDGFSSGAGTADYVTVNSMLPTYSSGMFAYSNYGSYYNNTANTLWIALAEKAYAQWNETGKEGRDGKNAYASIEGGWMGTVNAQVLGYNSADYIVSWASAKQATINALAANKAVSTGTTSLSGTTYGLYGNHAYGIIGYNASTDKFTLYNPWGTNQPGQLTWAQIQATCTWIVTSSTSGTVAISGKPTSAVSTSLKASIFESARVLASAETSLAFAESQTANETSFESDVMVSVENGSLAQLQANGASFDESDPLSAIDKTFAAANDLLEAYFDDWGGDLNTLRADFAQAGGLSSFVDATLAADVWA